MTAENKKLVDNFLREIKKNLPEWIKRDEERVEDILLEIGSHIWDSAAEIAESEDPDPASIQEAMDRLGSPKEVAKNYKKRGTPKYFISEELWSTYKKVILYLTAIIFTVIIIVQVVLVEPDNFLQALINGFTTSYPVILTFIVVITAIFVGLSDEGFFPKDLVPRDETKEPESDYYKPDEFLLTGLVGLLFGLFIIILPVDAINLVRIIVNVIIGIFGYSPMVTNPSYVTISIELRILLTLIGIVTVINGVTTLSKISTSDIKFQLNMNIVLIITGVVDFFVALYMMANLQLLAEALPLAENILLFLTVLGVIAAIIDIITNLSKNIKLYGILEEKKLSSTG
ncbi:MAG: hypothetical protein ACFFD4_30025 [Candidatus Odinarchaeota archaeon]